MEEKKGTSHHDPNKKVSLLHEVRELKKKIEMGMNEPEVRKKIDEQAEKRVTEEALNTWIQSTSLAAFQKTKAKMDASEDIQFSLWRLSKDARKMNQEEITKIWKKQLIMVEGSDIPPPITTFQGMRFPQKVMNLLKHKKLKHPTPIQMQGFPSALMGRDIIAKAPTGTGKTLVFLLSALLICYEEELKMPTIKGEGPFVIILLPSRELAIQIHNIATEQANFLRKEGYPVIKSAICIGGTDMREQIEQMRNGLNIVIGTPGRVSDLITKKQFNMNLCKLFVMDEADRLLDLAFEAEIKNVLDNFTSKRQTLLFSSTMSKKIQEFAKECLQNPIIINVGRAGADNLSIKQDVKQVKQEEKLPYILECLKRTAPPVLIFCENKADVDDVNEYLLIKGISAAGLHGGKTQQERNQALGEFYEGKRDVLVATDIAAKGLDFPDIKHVINFDMPKDIESYIHRIGRTGRQGRIGVTTTFVNKNQDVNILLDLKHFLIEARQEIPAFLQLVKSEEEVTGECNFCSGYGHRMANCPKLEREKMKALTVAASQHKTQT